MVRHREHHRPSPPRRADPLSGLVALALEALGYPATVLARQVRQRGTPQGADVRRLTVALATHLGATRQEAARAAGMLNHSSATFALRAHQDLVDTDPAYALAWEWARDRVATDPQATGTPATAVLARRVWRPGWAIHAVQDGRTVPTLLHGRRPVTFCGLTVPPDERNLDSVMVGPLDVVGARADGSTLHVAWDELPRFVTCGTCTASLRGLA